MFESCTLAAAADLRMRVDRKEDDGSRRLAVAERTAMYEDQKRRRLELRWLEN